MIYLWYTNYHWFFNNPKIKSKKDSFHIPHFLNWRISLRKIIYNIFIWKFNSKAYNASWTSRLCDMHWSRLVFFYIDTSTPMNQRTAMKLKIVISILRNFTFFQYINRGKIYFSLELGSWTGIAANIQSVPSIISEQPILAYDQLFSIARHQFVIALIKR